MSRRRTGRRRPREENDEDAEAQKLLDQDFLDACWWRTQDEVMEMLQKGANLCATNSVSQTGLILSCMRNDWSDALPVVKLLLCKKMSLRHVADDGYNALHNACRWSSLEVVQELLDADPRTLTSVTANSEHESSNGRTALMCSSFRADDEAVRVATLLLWRGADIAAVSPLGHTALTSAAMRGRPDVVSLLLAHGANVNAALSDGRTALHLTCQNGVFGSEIIRLLVAAGADVMAKNGNGDTPFNCAACTSGALVEALIPFLPQGFKQDALFFSEQDPIGSLVWCSRYGATPHEEQFASGLERRRCANECWSRLRNGIPLLLDNSVMDVFCVLQRSGDVDLWKWASSEPQMQQHPITGDTVFHLLCRSDVLSIEEKLLVLSDLKAHHRNPLVPNYRNQLCAELTSDAKLKGALRSYMCWQPHKLAMEWFGPCFRMRAWTLLLLCQRLRKEHPRSLAQLGKDVRHLLVKHLARVEYIYVPTKI